MLIEEYSCFYNILYYMFYTYDYTNFPNITIYFSKQLIQDEELDLFLKDWEDLYAKNTPFTLIFT